jgi:hypothetical protein
MRHRNRRRARILRDDAALREEHRHRVRPDERKDRRNRRKQSEARRRFVSLLFINIKYTV